MKKYDDILVKLITLTNTMNKTSKLPRNFGVGTMLYPSEIHTIEVIGANEMLNANALAKVLGITGGAVTQMTDRLIKKKLLAKYMADDNKKKVYFKLTPLGCAASQAHDIFHEQAYQNIREYLDQLNPDQIEAIAGFLDLYIENLPST